MLDADLTFINEEFHADRVTPRQMDLLLENGWRHFGPHFFRYNIGLLEFDIRPVIPLRIRLADFSFSKSQRRVLRKNADLQTIIRPIEITAEAETLFERHKRRFKQNIPDSIYDFLPPVSPLEAAAEVSVYENERLVAVSYFDIGEATVSGIYAMFDPEITSRGLGIFTLLKEIEFAIESGKEFYYQGYVYEGESFYDYKKRFRASEMFDWNGTWSDFQESDGFERGSGGFGGSLRI